VQSLFANQEQEQVYVIHLMRIDTLTHALLPCRLPGYGARMIRARISFVLSVAIVCLSFLFARTSHAAGKVTVSTTEVSEISGAWRVRMTIELPKPPSTAHIPMKFVFTPIAVYERTLVDGKEGPVNTRMAVTGQNPNIESLDVDFADASGKTFNRTRFDFGVTRIRGFQAGEYKMQVRTSDGTDVGAASTITLKGDNEVVDRRSVSFNAKDPKMKKVESGIDAGAPTKNVDDGSSNNGNGEVEAVGNAAPFVPKDAYDRTPEEDIKVRPKGCGCDVQANAVSPMAVLVLAGLAALLMRRRSEA
jgi:MYXO-CTERM domain-containing protein